jgi:hypothetical protein
MPTVPQLPAAAAVGPNDEFMVSQGGQSLSVTTQVLLASTQPQLTLSSGTLLGRVSTASGGPEVVPVGSGLVIAQGTLTADTTVVAPLASPSLTGRPTAPTPPVGDNSQALATTAFVANSSETLTFVGDVVGSGTSPITLVLPPIANPGVYTKVTVNGKGQVTSGGTLLAADIVAALGYQPASASGPPQLAGVDASAALVYATGATVARSLASAVSDRISILAFGADPTGGSDSAPAFNAAMSEVPNGGVARIFVPRGTYRLASVVNEPAGRSITVEFDDGASISGPGYLGVDRVETHQGPFRLTQVAGGFAGYTSGLDSPGDIPFDSQIITNTSTNSAANRVAWARSYTNENRYAKYTGGSDIAEQDILAWPLLLDSSAAIGHFEVVEGPTYDEDLAQRAGLGASAQHSEYDVVNNGPESGWSFQPGVANPVQGMAIDPWGQNGTYGGHILYAFGTAGGFDGVAGGVNRRWIGYPAVYSNGNPPAVPQGSTVVITMDVTAKATAVLGSGGQVASVAIGSGGGAYTSAPAVAFSGGGGSGAAGAAKLVGGAVVGVVITNPGSGYSSPPLISLTGGGVPAPNPVTVTVNPDGAHGDVGSIAAAIRAAHIPLVNAAVAVWGGAVSSLVVFGTAAGDVGTLTLGGTALTALGIPPQGYTTPRDDTAIVFGGTGHVSPGDQIIINGTTISIAGAGALADVVAAVTQANLPGVRADITAAGGLVLTAWLAQQPCGLVLAQPSGFTTLQKLSLNTGVFLPPTPPKAFATGYGEVGAKACKLTDAIRVSATDLAGNTYGPVTATLNGGAGTGSVPDVVASIKAALTTAGWYSGSLAQLTVAPSIVTVFAHNATTPGIVIRNTAGGTLTLANAAGTPLDTLGLVAGTLQPGGYSPGSQTVYQAAPNSIAPQGRGVFIGGSTVPDATVWPHTPAEFRGSFAHGLRTDKASFGDGNAVLLGSGQAIGWGVGGPTLSATAAALTASAPVVLPGLTLTQLPSSPTGLPTGSVWNNGGVLSIV